MTFLFGMMFGVAITVIGVMVRDWWRDLKIGL